MKTCENCYYYTSCYGSLVENDEDFCTFHSTDEEIYLFLLKEGYVKDEPDQL